MVLGASLKPDRYSHRAVIRLNSHNHPVIAVGLREGKIGDIEVITFDTALAKADALKENLETITLYLNPRRQEHYYNLILSLKPKRVIFNPGTENPELYALLNENNITSEVACTLVLLGTGQYDMV